MMTHADRVERRLGLFRSICPKGTMADYLRWLSAMWEQYLVSLPEDGMAFDEWLVAHQGTTINWPPAPSLAAHVPERSEDVALAGLSS